MGRLFVILGILGAAIAVFFFLASGGVTESGSKTIDMNKPGREKILRLALDTEPKTLDPIQITDTISDGVARKVHNTLVRFDRNKSTGELEVKPDLAEKFELSADGKTYTFHLRKGVQFHNGREMKAEDVVYSLTRLLTPASKRPEWLSPFVVGSEEFLKDQKTPLGITATGEYTVKIELNSAFAPFIQHLCTVNCAVVPKEAIEHKTVPFSRTPVGVGAFKLKEWRDNEVLILERNEKYFKGAAKLSQVKFFIMKEPTTRLENFFAGQLDATDLPYGRLKESVARAGDENVLKYETFRTNYIGIGFPNGETFAKKTDLTPFGTNKLLRQAMSYALDRDYLCNSVLEGRGVPARGVLPPGMPGFKERPGWPKDLDKAKKLMADAGFPDGKGLPAVLILHRNDDNTRKMAQVIVEDISKIGIKAQLQAMEWNRFLEEVEKEPKPMFLLGWVADYPDPDNFLYVLFHTKQWGSPGNHTWYSNAEVDRLTEQARVATEMKDRIPLYQKAEDIILDECPWICTYHVRNVVLLRKEIKGIRENVTPLDTGTEFPQVDFAFVDIVD